MCNNIVSVCLFVCIFTYIHIHNSGYMELLVRNFNIATVDGLMCNNIVSVGYNGHMYDCDFNQQLAIG
jgi:hypothetical protein